MTYQEEENSHVEKILNGFGISVRDEEAGKYRSVNEVMIDVGMCLKKIRESGDEKFYQRTKDTILLSLLGKRYRYECS
ncbi:hypothetical protein SDC9_54727 [bioreactor metagenome]|uniref:Uncharacterized protein n=1 Tax=bioreactor metagenome TaxID=1076179 RepID=A0A644WWW7_9ZZZZ